MNFLRFHGHHAPWSERRYSFDKPPSRKHWRRWRVVHRIEGWAYQLGIVSGACYSSAPSGPFFLVYTRFRGKRPYILGWDRHKWECLLRFHHWPYWPEGRPVFMGRCGKCWPWSCCGSIELDHDPTCKEYEPPFTYADPGPSFPSMQELLARQASKNRQ